MVVDISCSQLIWVKSRLQDYGVAQDVVPSFMTPYCDNISVINIFRNAVQWSHTKHIDIGHYLSTVLSKIK